jgi:hypothetical protein
MTNIRLAVRDGGHVADVLIPPFVALPDVIVWEGRFFLFHHQDRHAGRSERRRVSRSIRVSGEDGMSEKEIAMIHWSGKCNCGVEEWGACAHEELAAAATELFRRCHAGEGHKVLSWKVQTEDLAAEDRSGKAWKAASFSPAEEGKR